MSSELSRSLLEFWRVKILLSFGRLLVWYHKFYPSNIGIKWHEGTI